MATVTTQYVRLTSVIVNAGGGETRLLKTGTAGTNFNGSVDFAAGTLNQGDVIKIHAWGTWGNSGGIAGTGRVRLYFNPGATLANPIADTGANINLPAGIPASGETEWHFFALFTIRSTGTPGSGWCGSFFENVQDPMGFNRMAGGGSLAVDTSKANDLDLTATVTVSGSITLAQCSIEYLPTP